MKYFDWNATAPLDPVARRSWEDAVEMYWANPSTPYRLGARARNALEGAREAVGALFKRDASELVFTSGATESNNAVLREFLRWHGNQARIAISAIEHPSVLETARGLWGDQVCILPVESSGRLNVEAAREVLRKHSPVLVSVMAANNETGVHQPWREMAEVCREMGIALHVDASQWVGKESLEGLDVPGLVTFSGHKFGGPKGVGGLFLSPEFQGLQVQWGGAQENDHRSGTENIPAIVAMSVALESRIENPVEQDLKTAPEAMVRKLRENLAEILWHGEDTDRLWNTVSLALPEFPGHRWIARLDKAGFQVSSGSACSTGKEGPSPNLAAMDVNPDTAARTLRISGGWTTTREDWNQLGDAILEIYGKLREDSASRGGHAEVIDI